MSNDDHNWITARITQARNQSPLVTEAALTEVTQLLKGNLSKQTLSQKELGKVASLLIANMVPDVADAEAKQ